MFHAILVYIKTRKTRSKNGEQIILQGRLTDGRSYGISTHFRPRFYVLEDDRESVLSVLSEIGSPHNTPPLHGTSENKNKTMWGRPVFRLDFPDYPAMHKAHRSLRSKKIACYEGDLSTAQQFLIEHDIRLCFTFDGKAERGRHVDLRFIDPLIQPRGDAAGTGAGAGAGRYADCTRNRLNIIAIDIETSREGEVRCISLAGRNVNHILTLARDLPATAAISPDEGSGKGSTAHIREFPDEKQLLEGLVQEIRALDPDIITGWNVISFDMAVLLRRMKELGVATLLGRSREQATFLPGSGDLPDIADLPGRQVIDTMRLQRMQSSHFESYTLEYVSQQLLGRGKREQFDDKIDVYDGEKKMEGLNHLWENDPLRYVLYCLEDSRLVMDILKKTRLIELTLKRCELCGTTMSRAWASIHSFDHLYISALHKQHFVAPDTGVDRLPMTESPGGTILSPESGLFDRVLLFDFKGLYPSIIRTFGIDPLAHITALSHSLTQTECPHGHEHEHEPTAETAPDLLHSPNGAAFHRGQGILPKLLTHFYQLREEAKRQGDETASYVFKILANSFYGILGSPGCRFASSDIATAITSFAKEILHRSRDFVQHLGYHVIYGDTDSLFLIPPEGTADAEIFRLAANLSSKLNRAISKWAATTYGVKSYLEIEFEHLFAPLFIPPLKSVASQDIQEMLEQSGLSGPQGRAKSYAGLAFSEAGFKTADYELVIKGMEAVRSDWTKLARKVQRELLHKIFTGARNHQQEIIDYLTNILRHIQTPEGFNLLIIKKRLSKAASQYRGNLPPHVRAALLAEKRRAGKQPLRRIQYVMTTKGPEPYFGDVLLPDINWYIEKQMLPVLRSINAALPYDLIHITSSLFSEDGQLDLGI